MFCENCFKLLDDNDHCTNPACPSYVGSDENVIEPNTIDENQVNKNTLKNTVNEELFKQPKVNTVSEELFKQPKINTANEKTFKQPKISTTNEEIFKQPKINTANEEIFKQPKVNTVSEELFKQPKINSTTEIFKQPKITTINEGIFKQPKINNEIIGQAKIDNHNDNHNDNDITPDFTINSYDNNDFTQKVPIITDSMYQDEDSDNVTFKDNVKNHSISDDDFSEEMVSNHNRKKSDFKNKDTKKKDEIKREHESPKLDDYFDDDLIDADELIDNSTDDEVISEKEMLLAFVGKKKRSYYSQYIDTYLNEKSFISFNVCSFFFTLWWFWYRKMYIPTIIIAAVNLVSMALLPQPLKLIVMLAISLFSGLLGNQLYLKFASKCIDKIKADTSSDNITNRALLKLLKTNGGTTNIPIVVCIVFIIAMIVLLTFGIAYFANLIMGF